MGIRRIAMYRHLVIATDGSELAEKAVTQGLALAKTLGAGVTAVTVTEPLASLLTGDASIALPLKDYERAAAANAARILGAVASAAKTSGVPCEIVHVKEQFPAEGIVETAKARGGDLIIMASHGRRGLSKLLLGSETAKVLSQTSIPVLVCR
jgi:nucleotide-binding universal stress UspA family protein